MKIYYINHFAKAPSHGSSGRPYFLARELQERGHEVLVVAASDHHTRLHPVPPEQTGRPVRLDEIDFFFVPTRAYRGNSGGRYLNMRDFTRGVQRLGTWIRRGDLFRPDVIIASSAHIFAYPAALSLASTVKAKIIFEVRDLWPLSLVQIAGMSPRHPMVWWMERIESKAYRTADAVVSLLPGALGHMQPRGLDPGKFNWIPNGVWRREWRDTRAALPEEHRRAIEACRRAGKLLVVYAGAHGPPNALEQVLDLARVGGSDRPYRFLFIGDGVSKAALMARTAAEKIDFVRFLPRITKEQSRSAILEADACFIGWQPLPIYRYGISPNKLFEYMMASKPVLHAVGAEQEPVSLAGAGLRVPPGDPAALDEALRAMASMPRAEREEMGRRGREHVMRHYEWSVLGHRYEELCARVAADCLVKV